MAKAKKIGKSAPGKKAGAKKAAALPAPRASRQAGKKVASGKAAKAKAAEVKQAPNGKKANGKVAKEAPNRKQVNGKVAEAKKAPNAEAAKKEPKVTQADLEALRKPVDEAKARLDKARAEAKVLTDKAQALVKGAKDAYRTALVPYREACRKAGVECQFEGGRSANVSEKVSFLVEKTDKGVRVMVRGRPETSELIPLEALKESPNRLAYDYVTRHVGPREKVGNKGGSLGNRLRAILR